MGVREVPPFCVFVHVVEEVFYPHLSGSVSYGGESQSHFFCWSLDPLRGEVVEYAGCLAQRLVQDAVYIRELSVSEDSQMRCVVFRLEELFYYKGFVGWAKVSPGQGFGYESNVFGNVGEVFLEV